MDSMNEIDASVDDAAEPVEGQSEEATEALVETPEAAQELFDFTEVADKMVRLQVDGQEVLVPVKEALAGYQRQADYTRKTQEISEQRKQLEYAKALQEALQNDPHNTLRLLNQQYNTQLPLEGEDEYLDPQAKQVKDLEKRLVAFEQKQAMDELTRTIDSLQSKYGDDFNADEVVAKALATGQTDLESVFKQMAFDKVYSKASESQKKLAEETNRVQAKKAAQVVSSASTAKPTVTAPARPKSIIEAYQQAKDALN